MIQRIQSIYLLIVTGLLIAAMCLPVGQFIASDGVTAYVFKHSRGILYHLPLS